MTGEVHEAQENITMITKHKALQTPSRKLELGIDWV